MLNLRTTSIAAVVLTTALAGSAFAATITLTGTQPDVYMDTGSITYTASTKTLVATGTAEYVTNGTKTNITAGTFVLTAKLATVSGSGSTEVFSTVNPGSSLSITGAGPTTYFASSNLLQFGYSTVAGSDDFQFIFGPGTGIDYQAGKDIAVSLHGDGGTTYSVTKGLDQNFAETFLPTSTSDTFNVTATPEPASISLMGLAIPMLLRRRRHA